MKLKIFFLITMALFVQNLFAQEKMQGEEQKSDTIIIEKNRNEIDYKLILEYGLSTGIKRYYYKWEYGEEMRTVYSGLGFSLTAINNIAFNNRFLLGIGGGIEYRSLVMVFPMELSGICFLNFRYYFHKPEKVVIPMLNIAIGGRMGKVFDGVMADNPWHLSETRYGIYSTFGAGFKVKLFSLQGGILFWTKGDNLFGVDAIVKAGLNF